MMAVVVLLHSVVAVEEGEDETEKTRPDLSKNNRGQDNYGEKGRDSRPHSHYFHSRSLIHVLQQLGSAHDKIPGVGRDGRLFGKIRPCNVDPRILVLSADVDAPVNLDLTLMK